MFLFKFKYFLNNYFFLLLKLFIKNDLNIFYIKFNTKII